jgi:hypothetical protein
MELKLSKAVGGKESTRHACPASSRSLVGRIGKGQDPDNLGGVWIVNKDTAHVLQQHPGHGLGQGRLPVT